MAEVKQPCLGAPRVRWLVMSPFGTSAGECREDETTPEVQAAHKWELELVAEIYLLAESSK